MDLPAELFVSAVPNSDDLVAFNFNFALEGKALDGPIAVELDDGDLLIEGWAAEFEGEDREGENFTDGAFERGIKAFLKGSSPLCYHHKTEKCLGKVLELEEVEGKGLRMKARVDGAIRSHPELGTYYEQIKKGTLTALSVGGFFKRAMTPSGPRINECDFTEISVTPVPVHTKPAFAVVAGKALLLGHKDDGFHDEVGSGQQDALNESAVLTDLSASLERLAAALPEGKAAPDPKGSWDDLYSLALILALEQQTNSLDDNEEHDGDAKVDALIEKVKVCLDDVAKEAHALAAKFGPLPKVSVVEGVY